MKGNKLIREQRLNRNLTQKELGELLGYKGESRQTRISSWESGKRQVPRRKIKELAKLLGIPAEKLIQ